jgi:hypothetical protein
MVSRAYRRATLTVAIAATALVATLVVATIATGSVLAGPPHHHPSRVTGRGSLHTRHRTTLAAPVLPQWLGATLIVLLGIGVVTLLVFARGRRRADEERLLYDEDDDAPGSAWEALLSVELGEAAAEQLTALVRGSPRNAIVACWLRLQEATRRAGLPAEASETSHEFTVRAMRRLHLDDVAITTLSRLYREARFSDHEMVEMQRAQAVEALGVLAGQLAPSTGRYLTTTNLSLDGSGMDKVAP